MVCHCETWLIYALFFHPLNFLTYRHSIRRLFTWQKHYCLVGSISPTVHLDATTLLQLSILFIAFHALLLRIHCHIPLLYYNTRHICSHHFLHPSPLFFVDFLLCSNRPLLSSHTDPASFFIRPLCAGRKHNKFFVSHKLQPKTNRVQNFLRDNIPVRCRTLYTNNFKCIRHHPNERNAFDVFRECGCHVLLFSLTRVTSIINNAYRLWIKWREIANLFVEYCVVLLCRTSIFAFVNRALACLLGRTGYWNILCSHYCVSNNTEDKCLEWTTIVIINKWRMNAHKLYLKAFCMLQ